MLNVKLRYNKECRKIIITVCEQTNIELIITAARSGLHLTAPGCSSMTLEHFIPPVTLSLEAAATKHLLGVCFMSG